MEDNNLPGTDNGTDAPKPAKPAKAAEAAEPAKAADDESWESVTGDVAGASNPYAAPAADPYAAPAPATEPMPDVAGASNAYAAPAGNSSGSVTGDVAGASNPYAAPASSGYAPPASNTYAAPDPYAGTGASYPPPTSTQTPPPGYGAYGSVPPVSAIPPQSSGKAVGALVCGILAVLFSFTIILGVVLGIVAIVLAGSATRQSGKDGKTTGGKICGIIGIILSILMLVASLIFGAALVAVLSEGNYYIDDDGTFYTYAYDDTDNAAEETGAASGTFDSLTADSTDSTDDAPASTGTEDSLIADEGAAAQAATGALKNIASNSTLAAQLATWAEADFEYVTDNETLSDVGLSGEELVSWMCASVQCAPDDDGVFVNEDGTATVFLEGTCYSMETFLDAVEESLNAMTDVTDRKIALTQAVTEAMSTAETSEFYAMLELTYESGVWTVEQDSLQEEAQYMFSLWE